MQIMPSDTQTGQELTRYDAGKLVRDERRVRRGFWRKMRRVAGKIPFAKELLAAYYAALDKDTPTYVRAVLMGALAYFVMPIDMVPDFILAFGFGDDATVLAAAIGAVRGYIKPKHHDEAAAWFDSHGE